MLTNLNSGRNILRRPLPSGQRSQIKWYGHDDTTLLATKGDLLGMSHLVDAKGQTYDRLLGLFLPAGLGTSGNPGGTGKGSYLTKIFYMVKRLNITWPRDVRMEWLLYLGISLTKLWKQMKISHVASAQGLGWGHSLVLDQVKVLGLWETGTSFLLLISASGLACVHSKQTSAEVL